MKIFGNDLFEKAKAKLSKRLDIKTRERIKETEDDTDVPLVYNAIMGEIIWKKVLSLI